MDEEKCVMCWEVSWIGCWKILKVFGNLRGQMAQGKMLFDSFGIGIVSLFRGSNHQSKAVGPKGIGKGHRKMREELGK